MWKVLHSVAAAPPALLRANSAVLITFLRCLKQVLPCVYCRDSYANFLTELPDLQQTVEQGRLFEWMFRLHSKVNQKLKVPDPEFERVQKRYAIRPVQWCANDVWDLVALFGINYSSSKTEVYRVWWETFIEILRLAGADARQLNLMRQVECPCSNGAFVATSLLLKSAHEGRLAPSREELDKQTRLYALAKAKTCANGGCK